MYWNDRPTLVTGGASFIGSHLIDALVRRGARVRAIDDLSSGTLDNLRHHLDEGSLEFIEADLREPDVCRRACDGIATIFHLAADHGGRGYVDLHQAGPASNLFLDGLVFHEASKAGVDKVVFASSGCVYPNFVQTDPDHEVYLTEDMVKPPHDADNMYGWAKLMGEMTLEAYHREYGLKAASCRYFTVFGPRGVENHAVIALIAKAYVGHDPIEIWGDGTQVRNWTYIDDIVEGTVLAAEKIDDATAVNLGTMERVTVKDAIQKILEYTGRRAEIRTRPDMPTGPLNRVADNALARKLLDWEPQISFDEGLRRTIDWYQRTKDPQEVRTILDRMLTER